MSDLSELLARAVDIEREEKARRSADFAPCARCGSSEVSHLEGPDQPRCAKCGFHVALREGKAAPVGEDARPMTLDDALAQLARLGEVLRAMGATTPAAPVGDDDPGASPDDSGWDDDLDDPVEAGPEDIDLFSPTPVDGTELGDAPKADGYAPCPECGGTDADVFADGRAACTNDGTAMGRLEAKGHDFTDPDDGGPADGDGGITEPMDFDALGHHDF